ncbi:MAG: succinylglutamate desuccinylase/aspartoacylase family protein, partial [Planctomycetes bacterium]|nr:succinylglutamate desuccinylase/aspartoacylase family protein [Planctomycetota bacterium]
MNERAQKLASVAMLILSMALAACSGPTRHPVEGDSPKANAPANQPQLKEPEKPKEPAKPVWTKRVVITTGVHGNEPSGYLVQDQLKELGFTVFGPCNPWGIKNNKRELEDGRDLNRFFQDDTIPQVKA